MADDDLLDVLDVVTCLGDRGLELMFGLIPASGEDVIEGGAPDLCCERKDIAQRQEASSESAGRRLDWKKRSKLTRVVLTATSLPQNEALSGMFDEDRIHNEVSTFGLSGSLWVAHG